MASTLLGLEPDGAELATAELPQSADQSAEASAAVATGAAEPRQLRSAGAAARLLPALVAALLVGVLAGAARSRRCRS